MSSWPFETRADLYRCIDHGRALRGQAIASGEAWAATKCLFTVIFAPLLGLLRRGRVAAIEQPVVGTSPGGPTAAA